MTFTDKILETTIKHLLKTVLKVLSRIFTYLGLSLQRIDGKLPNNILDAKQVVTLSQEEYSNVDLFVYMSLRRRCGALLVLTDRRLCVLTLGVQTLLGTSLTPLDKEL